jgi:hypothetical protein
MKGGLWFKLGVQFLFYTLLQLSSNQSKRRSIMSKRKSKKTIIGLLLVFFFVSALISPTPLLAGKPESSNSQGAYWKNEPEEEATPPYPTAIPYSEIGRKLREIEVNSNRVKVEVIGQSAGGRDLYLVTLSAPEAMGRLGRYQAIRSTMLKDPEKAQELIDKFGDFKVPVFINGSIHGNEYEGTDACIRLIETLAFGDSEEVQAILNNTILLFNVVQNPDGRVLGTRANSKGIDINRDFITQTQPEARATVRVITEWNPMIFLDLHDDFQPMLIEPCTPIHNPNYEYDLYIKWALHQAYAMEAELVANTDETEALIPFRDWDWGWDDWPPIYTPMYAMYHGSYGHTLETPYEDERGVDAHYWAVWGALKFVAANRAAMVRDQIEIFRRGFLDLTQELIPDKILDETPYDQYNELTIKEFPAAYVIPVDGSMQLSSHQPARLVDFLLFNDVQVEKASQSFKLNGVSYPEGTYIVWMDQPKRGLANAILEDGMDVSDIEGIIFYSAPSAWSHPLLWGVTRAVMQEKISVKTNSINQAQTPKGSLENGKSEFYGYLPSSLTAFKATNALIKNGITVYRAKDPFDNAGKTVAPGAFILTADPAVINELVNQYALDIFKVSELPEEAVSLQKLDIAVYGDAGDAICLDELGFDYDMVSIDDLNSGIISQYDLFINNPPWWLWDFGLNDAGRASITAYFAAGGDYIGLKEDGILFAQSAGAVSFTHGFNWYADAISKINYNPMDTVSSTFREDGYGYIYGAFWFDTLPAGAAVSATIAEGDFMVAGSWTGWETDGAAGKPVIVYIDNDEQDISLIGIDATFRGHPKNTFRLVGNAIYSGLD